MKADILAVTDNVIRLKADTLQPSFLSRLEAELTRENPQYHQMSRMRNSNLRKYQHMKMPPKFIRSITKDDHTVYVPRGCKDLLKELANKFDQDIKWIDERVFFTRHPDMAMVEDFKLLPYQQSNLAAPLLNESGVIWMPCGGGKTVMGIAMAMTLAQPTLILVHTHDLLHQWVGELQSKALVPGGVGVYGGGTKRLGVVTVATVQTLTRMDQRGHNALHELLGKFGCVILDECHHCPATTFLGLVNLTKARYRYGFTATKERKDGLHFLMHDVIGPVVATVGDKDLESVGRSQSVRVVEVNTPFYSNYTAAEWTQLVNAITADANRNDLIVENVLKSWQDGHFPLILSDRVSHCMTLQAALQRAGMNAQLLIGSVPKGQRNLIVKNARDNLVDAIVATQVADEGLDIPALSCLHMTTPTGNRGKVQQRVGRIRRPKERESVLYDYVDSRIAACARMYRARKRLYKEWGFGLQSNR